MLFICFASGAALSNTEKAEDIAASMIWLRLSAVVLQTCLLMLSVCLSPQHTLTSTAELVLQRLAHRVSELTAGSGLESDGAVKEKEAATGSGESAALSPTP